MSLRDEWLEEHGIDPEGQDRDAFSEQHRGYIGGTDAAAILGLHPKRTPWMVWAEKKGLTPPLDLNANMERGQDLEWYVASLYERESGHTLVKAPFVQDMSYRLFGVSPDYIDSVTGEPVEVKTAGRYGRRGFGEEGSDFVPSEYLVQLIWQLMLLPQATKGVIAALLGLDLPGDFRTYPWARDAEMIDTVRSRVMEWTQTYIVGDRVPEVTGIEQEQAAIKLAYPVSTGESVTFDDPDLHKAFVNLALIKTVIKQEEIEKDRYEAEIKVAMGENAIAIFPGLGTVTWRNDPERRKFDEEEFRSEHPALWESYAKLKPGARRFLFKPIKESAE